MYDADPRDHLERAKRILSGSGTPAYAELRYAALDLRLAIETTFQEILSACYSEFSKKFRKLYQSKEFVAEIREQNPDFDLKNRLVPTVLRARREIVDYQALDLDRLSGFVRRLGDHLHHLNRYDRKKASSNRASALRDLTHESSAYLDALLKYPLCWIEFQGVDQARFEEVVSGKRTYDEFERLLEAGQIKNVTIVEVHHKEKQA